MHKMSAWSFLLILRRRENPFLSRRLSLRVFVAPNSIKHGTAYTQHVPTRCPMGQVEKLLHVEQDLPTSAEPNSSFTNSQQTSFRLRKG